MSYVKELFVAGTVSNVTGRIVVSLNYSTQEYKSYNPSDHEHTTKYKPVHKVDGFIFDTLSYSANSIDNEKDVLKEIEKCEKQLLQRMKDMANSDPNIPFSETLKKIGFNLKNK